MEVAAFWIAIGAVLVAYNWRNKHLEAMRHETARALIAKDKEVDPAELRDLLGPPADPWRCLGRPVAPGQSGRGMKAVGTILMIAGPGLGGMVASIGLFQTLGVAGLAPTEEGVIAIGVGIGIAIFLFLLGFAVHFASRFLSSPLEGGD